MGFLFEVAQIEAQGWIPSAGDDWVGVYLEVTCNKAARTGLKKSCKAACCRSARKGKKQQKQTAIVDEQREMRWREVNEDGFLVALFVLGDERKRRRKGDQLIITAHAYSTNSMAQEVEGTRVATFEGRLQVGNWGPVVLKIVDRNSMEGTTLVLETRPLSARPFSLESARPADDLGSLSVIMKSMPGNSNPTASREVARRGKDRPRRRIQTLSQLGSSLLSNLQSSSGPEKSHSIANLSSQASASSMSPNKRNNNEFESQGIGSQRPSFYGQGTPLNSYNAGSPLDRAPSAASDPTKITSGISIESVNPTGSRETTAFTKLVQMASRFKSDDSFISVRTKAGNTLVAQNRWPAVPRQITEEFGFTLDDGEAQEQAKWASARKLLGRIALARSSASLNSRCPEPHSKWIPTDWTSTWQVKFSGRGNEEDTFDGTDVVPVMEAEFRRDCVVLFNTMFPRSQAENFLELRRLALTENSKLQFKKVNIGQGNQSSRRASKHDTIGSGESSGKNFWTRIPSTFFTVRPSKQRPSKQILNPSAQQEDEVASDTNSASNKWDDFETSVTSNRVSEQQSQSQESPGTGVVYVEDNEFDTEIDLSGCLEKDRWVPLVVASHANKRTAGSTPILQSITPGSLRNIGAAEDKEEAPDTSSSVQTKSLEVAETRKQMLDLVRSSNLMGKNVWRTREREATHTTISNSMYSIDYDEAARLADVDAIPEGEVEAESEDRRVFSAPSPPPPRNRMTDAKITPFLVRTGNEFLSTNVHGLSCLASGLVAFVDDYSPRIMLLKRLFLCFAQCGVYYSEAGNTAQLGDLWPYPLAAVLGHGSRILIRLDDVDSTEFLNFLLSGNPHTRDWKESGVPWPIRRRIAATHSVEITELGQLVERKLRVSNAAQTVQNISDGLRKKHMGIDLPIGGVGNPSPLGRNCVVGFRGEVISKQVDQQSESRFDRFKKYLIGGNGCSPMRPKSPTKRSPVSPSNTPASYGRQESTHSTDADTELGSMTDVSVASTVRTSRTTADDGWKLVRRIQGGHLYIRTDDFGVVSSAAQSSSSSSQSVNFSEPKLLRNKPARENLQVTMAKMRKNVELRSDLLAGELFFPSSVVRLNSSRRARAGAVGGNSGDGSLRLLRVSSEPDLSYGISGGSADDMVWVGRALVSPQNRPLPPPPSATALRMLLEHIDPVNAQLYGTGSFKTVEAFFEELNVQSSLLARSQKGFLQRYCRPVILQLRFRGRVLMKMAEQQAHGGVIQQNPSFAAVSANAGERWRSALLRLLQSELDLNIRAEDDFSPERLPDDCLSVLTETTMSPSYPGMTSVYRTHMVRWDVKEDEGAILESLGLCFPHPHNDEEDGAQQRVQNSLPLNCHFTTFRQKKHASKKIFWRWVPFFEAQKLQRFINMGEATADERWAKYAFQKEGVVQFPPTEGALCILLRRCGIDVDLFSTGNYRSIHDFWLDLTAKESLLQMSGGQPLRLANSTVVRVRWKPPGEDQVQVLVNESFRTKGGTKATKPTRKLLTRRMLHGESWEESALNCLQEELGLTSNSAKMLLAHRPGDKSAYTFFEELTESDKYPGIKCLYRTHLVTYTVKEDVGAVLGRRMKDAKESKLESEPSENEMSSRATDRLSWMRATTSERKEVKKMGSLASVSGHNSSKYFVWCPDDEQSLSGVRGADLWEQVNKHQETHRVSSVLLGLEGTAPQMKSPFGIEHDGSGISASISALGNCKWRSYRKNNALQVPADEGGLRMRITRRMFEELLDMCQQLDFQDASFDLIASSGGSLPRELLDQRYAEQELLKKILGSNAVDAKKAVDWMKEYRMVHRTPGQAYQCVSRGIHLSRSRENYGDD